METACQDSVKKAQKIQPCSPKQKTSNQKNLTLFFFFPVHIGKYVKYDYISFIHFSLPQAFTRKSQRPCSAKEHEWAVVL